MKVITGIAKGVSLVAPQGEEVRPTSQRVKEGVFSAVQFIVSGAAVLDLFSGSGQIGIEALSRGAKSAVFVETRKESIQAIKTNLSATKLCDNAKIVSCDVNKFVLECSEKFDIIFLDPPYFYKNTETILINSGNLVSNSGIIICETDSKETLPQELSNNFRLFRQYKHGRVLITSYKSEED